MNKEFIPYEQALALKELGFDEPCLGVYFDKELHLTSSRLSLHMNNSNLTTRYSSAPLYQQAFRWFRDKHKLDGGVVPINQCGNHVHSWGICDITNVDAFWEGKEYKLFEEAELVCLKKLIEIVKNNEKER